MSPHPKGLFQLTTVMLDIGNQNAGKDTKPAFPKSELNASFLKLSSPLGQ